MSDDDKIALVRRPQRFGILPTMAFWYQDRNFRLALPITIPLGGLLAFVLIFGLGAFFSASGIGLRILAAGVTFVAPYLALGLIENYVRRRARRRLAERGPRRELEAVRHQALGENSTTPSGS